jgi:hypothetical protein
METEAGRRRASHENIVAESQASLPTRRERVHDQQGAKRLMRAVLADAVSCIESYSSGRGPQSWPACRAALSWVLARDQTWPFSFENICLALDLDAGRLRSALCSAVLSSLTAVLAESVRSEATGGFRPARR